MLDTHPGDRLTVLEYHFRNLCWMVLVAAMLFLGACGGKQSKDGSGDKAGEKDGRVTDATGEAEVGSATAEAKIAEGTEEKSLKKKEVVFKVPVFVEKLVRGEMKAYLSSNGTLAPEEQILVKAEINGKLTFSQDWKEGQPVKQGDRIASIDNEEIRFAKNEAVKNLQLAEEQVAPSKEKLKLAERNLASKKRMFDEGVISQLDYDQADLNRMEAELGHKQILASLETRRTELDKVKYRQDRAVIEAPFDGILVRKEYLQPQQGQSTSYPILSLDGRMVGAGEPLFGIMKTSRMRLDVDVSSKEIAKVEPDQEVEVNVYGSENIEVTGTVENISTALDPVTRRFKVAVMLDNPDGRLRAGMFCTADIVVDRRLDAISVPKEIVQTRSNRKIAFVIKAATDEEGNEKSIAEQREVVLGISNRFDVEITEGLHEGDMLVVRGHETLKDKTQVKLSGIDEDESEQTEGQKTEDEQAL